LGLGIASAAGNGTSSTATGVPFLALADLFTLNVMDLSLENQRALRLRYVPQETAGELARAPFSFEVLSRPAVWGGIAVSLAAGILVSRLVDSSTFDTHNAGKRPVLFGHEVNSALGYPAAAAIGVALFEQVALAEEMAFRGVIQSGLSRSYGETPGWIVASLSFGLIHASNIVFLDPSQRLTYLAVGVPFITLLGSYLGLTYRFSRYSLAPSVAIHFWYDLLLETAAFVTDPRNSPLAVAWGMPF
jgi:membrane protease YdiL (CAAX protease family)